MPLFTSGGLHLGLGPGIKNLVLFTSVLFSVLIAAADGTVKNNVKATFTYLL